VLAEQLVRVTYEVGKQGVGPVAIALNGDAVPFTREPNPYREGGAVVATADLRTRFRSGENVLAIRLR
jgi:hypothetical protein